MEGSVEKKDLRCVAGGAPKAGGPAPVAGGPAPAPVPAKYFLQFRLGKGGKKDGQQPPAKDGPPPKGANGGQGEGEGEGEEGDDEEGGPDDMHMEAMSPKQIKKALARMRALCKSVAGATFSVERENGDKNGRPVDVHCDCPVGMDIAGTEAKKDLRCVKVPQAPPAEAPAPPA